MRNITASALVLASAVFILADAPSKPPAKHHPVAHHYKIIHKSAASATGAPASDAAAAAPVSSIPAAAPAAPVTTQQEVAEQPEASGGGVLGALKRKIASVRGQKPAASDQQVSAGGTAADKAKAPPQHVDEFEQTWEPTIDTKGMDRRAYEADLADCRGYALETAGTNGSKEAANGAKKTGLVVGGAMVAETVATGGLALIPMVGTTIIGTAGGSALLGGSHARAVAHAKWQGVVAECLKGRGYKVLG